MSNIINNRYDFILLFDVKDGNPNGDPDAGNLPRVDPETGHGLVTDVCLKRKVRNYVQLAKNCVAPFDIYVKEKAVLGRAHVAAFKELGIQLGEELKATISKEVYEWLDENGLPNGVSIDADEDTAKYYLTVASDTDKKEVKDWLKEAKPSKAVKDAISAIIKNAKTRRPTGEEVEQGREKMCQTFYDIRTFGGVLSLKSAPNCGQVRGPVQLTFARSVGQVVPLEHSITRMAVATEAEAEKQQGDNRTMGRKFTIPYGLYRCHGFISSPFAAQTGFSEDDLKLFWTALLEMFEHDRSAARGQMATRKLIVFKHDSSLGSAPAHKLFDMVTTKANANPVRDFSEYEITIPIQADMPQGVTLEVKL
ncbi:MAG: type I-C CRISPR-associated protein Cas7/Csd2 [Nitrospiraceae bacterium]|nr:MAG: type I-C CRISPR-associated protein Cas7/Csd2 [Nitrospiraceae bacterium]